MKSSIDLDALKRDAVGRWPEILSALGGIESSILDGQHHPCPKCGGTDRFRMIDIEAGALYCSQCFNERNGDGLAALQWLTGSTFKRVVRLLADHLGHSGRHRRNGNGKVMLTARPEKAEKISRTTTENVNQSTAKIRHAVYSDLLSLLSLDESHREALRRRGMSDAEIDRRQYRTYPEIPGRQLHKIALLSRHGQPTMKTIPGFLKGDLIGPAGLLIPVRNASGQIIAISIRPDQPREGGGKYVWLSSRRKKEPNAPSPGAPIHVPIGIVAPAERIRVTEGALKADVSSSVDCTIPTIGIAGVSAWKSISSILKALVTKTVILAFDSDAEVNREVAKNLRKLARHLSSSGYDVQYERWEPDAAKGIDDLLAGGGYPELLTGDEAIAAIDALAGKHSSERDKKNNEQNVDSESQDDDAPKRTDLGNARRLVALYGADIRYVYLWGKWLHWDGRRWRIDTSGSIERMAKGVAKSLWKEVAEYEDDDDRKKAVLFASLSESAAKLAAMVRLSQSEEGIPIQPDDLDHDPWLLNVQNGTIDLRNGQLESHRKTDLISKICPAIYDPSALCPLWEKFLLDVFDGQCDLVRFVQRLLGYCLTGDVSEQIVAIFYGKGANGKSTLINAVLEIMGEDYSLKTPPDFLMLKRTDHPTAVTDLFGRRFVAAIETEENKRLAEALIKELTGGDRIRARRMREDYWEFSPSHKIILACNHKPEVRGTDHGIWRRIKLVPFLRTFDGSARDKQLPEKLSRERAGILAWLVRGCLEWQQHGLGDPEAVHEATAKYREEQDILRRFIADCCEEVPGGRAQASHLLEAYRQWAGNSSMSQRKLGDILSERGLGKVSINGCVFWVGLELKYDRSRPKNDASTSESDGD